jgi:hypothetical protein
VPCKLLGTGKEKTEKQTQERTITEPSNQTWHLASEDGTHLAPLEGVHIAQHTSNEYQKNKAKYSESISCEFPPLVKIIYFST